MESRYFNVIFIFVDFTSFSDFHIERLRAGFLSLCASNSADFCFAFLPCCCAALPPSSILISVKKSLGCNMLSSTSSSLRLAANFVSVNVRRNLGASVVVTQKTATDPVQGLFVEKIREYATKKKSAGGKLVDATKETEADLQGELDKVAKAYGGGKGVDMTKFPDFKWQEPKIENVDMAK